ncbi:hypothetical protein ACFWAX_29825 [Streptomyces sp. NPDC059956]|uniref:hypothetical protein n=1 Tax=Streptomyces sp. NPDC059956 TaxID=3347015 RepID=UPI003665D6D9
MRFTRTAAAAVALGLTAAAALTGCSEEKKAAAPQLPERSCFGVFTRSDLEPLMGDGETVKESSPASLKLTPVFKGGTCTIAVDGENRVLSSVKRQPLGQHFFWHLDDEKPDPLPFADNGRVWDGGAAVAITCQGSKDSFELELRLSGSVDRVKPADRRPLFTGLMKKYLDAAKEQTRCGV